MTSLINISARASIKGSKFRKCSWLSCWYIQLPVLHPLKKFVMTSKRRPFWKFCNIKTQLQFDLRYENTAPNYTKKVFFMLMMSSMTSQDGLKVSLLYSSLGEVGSRSKLQGQCIINKCEYHNSLKKISINHTFQDRRSKVNVRLTGWPWHLNSCNSIESWDCQDETKTEM